MQKMDIGGQEYETALTTKPQRPNMAPSVYLNDDQVAALGLSGTAVGTKLFVRASACVMSVSSHEDEDKDGKTVTVSLRFDEMEVEPPAKDHASALYKKD